MSANSDFDDLTMNFSFDDNFDEYDDDKFDDDFNDYECTMYDLFMIYLRFIAERLSPLSPPRCLVGATSVRCRSGDKSCRALPSDSPFRTRHNASQQGWVLSSVRSPSASLLYPPPTSSSRSDTPVRSCSPRRCSSPPPRRALRHFPAPLS